MARLDEIAEGLVTVLQVTPTPEPLPVDLMNHSPNELTFLVRAIVDSAERRIVPLSLIRIDKDFGAVTARALGTEPTQYEGVRVELVVDLGRIMELYRFPAD